MAKRSPSSSVGSAVGKVLTPSYYLRKPHRLALLCLFFVFLLFLGVDRQNSMRERQILNSKLQELEGERILLEGEAVGSAAKGGAGGGSKQQPLILGLTPQRASSSLAAIKAANKAVAAAVAAALASGGVGGDGSGSRASRKLLPDEKVKALDVGSRDGGAGERKADDAGSLGAEQKKDVAAAALTPEQAEAERRREAIRWGMIHAWGAYEQYAWGFDELQPQSKLGVNKFGGLGASIVDSLDTLYIMGLKDQFEKAKQWVLENMDFKKNYDASVFETIIRVLGGLLSAYDLSGERGFLLKAQDLAERLMPAWDTPTGLPYNYLNLESGHGFNAGWTGSSSILADSGTTTVEMIALSQRTGDPKYAAKAEHVIQKLDEIYPADGLLPLYISASTGRPTTSKISMGAMGDSFYEYLVKVWVQGGKTAQVKRYREMWDISMDGMLETLVKKTNPGGLTYLAERMGDQTIPKMDHLACFVPGMLVLGANDAEEAKAQQYLDLAKELTRTCYQFYERMPSKLSGEHYLFHDGEAGHDMSVGHAYNIGRPETVEALFYLWRKTKDPIYREWGWNIWQAFEEHCRLPSGYTGLTDVGQNPPSRDDMMQSFFLAETLKYLFLLFSDDDVMPLDQWVFNTEAHPVKIVPRTGPGFGETVSLGATEGAGEART
eukprot:TRINITY_DN1490_c0_g1_i1.p1 TRINITY_DN1490_c0_g1~~TRINITY_DN1490_c0_g1_i1.p1  ORF type:complete len:664 (-),score=202.07 TRINITY_DN1490_c0_g1_i1:463-2454(-)